MYKLNVKFFLVMGLLVSLSACVSTGSQTDGGRIGQNDDETDLPVPTADNEANYKEAAEQMRKRRFKGAQALLESVLDAEPEHTGALLNLAIVYNRTGKSDQAIDALEKYADIGPALPAAANEMGIALTNLGRYPEAEQSYQQALNRQNDYAPAHYNLGLLYDMHLADPTRAIEHYEQFLSADSAENIKVKVWLAALKNAQATGTAP